MLPPIGWLADRAAFVADGGPDPAALDRALAAHGIACEVIDPLPWPWNPGARAHPLLRGIDPLRTLRVLLTRRRVDAVLCVFEGPAVLPLLLRRWLGFRPRVLMWDIGLTDRWRLRQTVQNVVVPRLDAILVLGSNQRDEIARRWRRHPPLHAIGHHVDTGFFSPRASTLRAGILAVGDDEGRDYPLLLDAAAGLAPLTVRARTRLTDGPLPSGVRQITERLSYPALRDLYAHAAVVALPLHARAHAGGVTSLLEAAAMGCAIVVTRSPGIADWVQDGITCLTVPCGDAAALRQALHRLLNDAELRHTLGRAARSWVAQTCSVAAFAARLAEVLDVESPGLRGKPWPS